jgi:hypothetical protein
MIYKILLQKKFLMIELRMQIMILVKNPANNSLRLEHIYNRKKKSRKGRKGKLRNGIQLDNRWVVSHNIDLVTKYNAHINVEICNSILAIKYLVIIRQLLPFYKLLIIIIY